ncbi:Rho GTPase-activating protein 3 [Linum perenne]
MTRLFRSKSCGLVGITEFDSAPTPPTPSFFPRRGGSGAVLRHDDEDHNLDDDDDGGGGGGFSPTAISTPLISPASRYNDGGFGRRAAADRSGGNQFAILDVVVTALRRSLVTCSAVERDDVSSSSASLDISWPTEVKHVSHVTFDRFNGFLGLPRELEPELPRKVPSASANVFGVSAESMQCSYDDRGNSVPTILLMMQRRLYVEGGLKAEGIFRINAENSQEEYVRGQLNKGVVPREIDYHCLAGLIKAWFRELPSGVLDCLTPEQVMNCNTEDDCTNLVKMLPPMEAALLDWAINLMADVVEHEQYNKMNARNVAMVFAPNMTQMADPLTALIHAVQVMNLLKTLITRTIREREESSAPKVTEQQPSSHPDSPEQPRKPITTYHPHDSGNLSDSNTTSDEEEEEEDYQGSDSISVSSPTLCEMGTFEDGCKELYLDDDNETRNRSLSKGMKRLCRHPIFQFNKPAPVAAPARGKKMEDVGFVNREAAWA